METAGDSPRRFRLLRGAHLTVGAGSAIMSFVAAKQEAWAAAAIRLTTGTPLFRALRGGPRQTKAPKKDDTMLKKMSMLAGGALFAAQTMFAATPNATADALSATDRKANEPKKEKLQVYVGTFSNIFYSMQIDPETLEVENLHSIRNPFGRSAFFALSSDSKYLYVANEHMNGSGGIAAFKLVEGKDPQFLNAIPSKTQGPAHISLLNAYGKDFVFGSGFFEGDIMVCPVAPDGSLMPMSDNLFLEKGAHAHGIRPIPGTKFVVATDTQHGLLYTYELTSEGKLVQRHCFKKPGVEAPRHMTFSKDGRQLFLLTERTSTFEVFDINRETGELTHVAHFSNLPDGFTGDSSSAAIHRSPDGRFVYLSNRGHDSITAYRVEGGKATKVGCVKDTISCPREFMIDPTGKFMLVGNQQTSTISIFRLNKDTGMPEFTGKTIRLKDGPICFISLPKSED